MAAEVPNDANAGQVFTPLSFESDRRRSGTQAHLSTNEDIASQARPDVFIAPAPAAPALADDAPVNEHFGAKLGRVLKRHLHFVGPGIMSSVAFMDPGNWSTDLTAGAQFGYALLSVILMSSLVGIFLQVLAVRLGAVTGFDLARSTRLWLLPEEKEALDREVEAAKNDAAPREDEAIQRRPWKKSRLGLLWVLYFVAEGAIICTELAELVGSAIALNLLFPGLPLWAGTLVTSVDVFLILLVYREGGSMRAFEVLIALLVFCVMGCFIVLLARIDADWGDVFFGYIPSSTLVQADALYIAVGIVGATVMPHALYNASQWATVDRLEVVPREPEPRKSSDSEPDAKGKRRAGLEHQPTTPDHPKYLPAPLARLRARAHGYMSRLPSASLGGPRIPSPEGRDLGYKVSISNIRIHLAHATVDIVLSLIAFAMVVNSAILIVAAAAFYYGPEKREVGDLFEAFELLRTTVGKSSAILFAVALLAAGQSASLTVTLAGQLVSEGFIRWTTNAFWRRVLTRGIALVPSFAVAAAVGRGGLDRMLVASQVALSMALPFVLLPLLVLTGQRAWMTVREEPNDDSATRPVVSAERVQGEQDEEDVKLPAADSKPSVQTPGDSPNVGLMPFTRAASSASVTPANEAAAARGEADEEEGGVKVGRFANHWTVVVLVWLIYALIVLCDGFVIITSAMGKS